MYMGVKDVHFSSIPRIFKVQKDIKIILVVNNYKHMEPKSKCDKSFPGPRRSLLKVKDTAMIRS